ncbi:SRPBCC family protein [Arthrobacter oryzae]|uniref:SRPBCC family protein n=1 Tax=Arthrobacter oryzae TaxID=409290 RepID=UPI00273A986C|nr:SRPBCC family protein [Arthrobacter oryzae]WLQ05822.1 SRPBCC family protein [Arthrobacter oryzae]
MEYFESVAMISARTSIVWDVITDTGNLTVWESGIAAIHGELRDGGTVRIKTTDNGGRTVRLRVRQIPGEAMTLTSGPPLGLRKRIRTFTLAPRDGRTRLTVTEEYSGPLARLLRASNAGTARNLDELVGAVTKRAELLDRSF